MTPSAVNHIGWRTFLMFGIFCIANFVFVWFFIKETKGRTLEDMDLIFGTVEAEQRAADVERMMHKAMDHDDHVEDVAPVSEKTAQTTETPAATTVDETPAAIVGDEKVVH
jgi:hypothetical protein